MYKLLFFVLMMMLVQSVSAYMYVVEGEIMDQDGNRIPNHAIKSVSMLPGANRQAETDALGYYRFEFSIDGAQPVEIHIYTQSICEDELITHQAILKSFNGSYTQNFEICHTNPTLSACKADFIPIIAGGGHTLAFFNASLADSIVSYHWDFGDGSQSSESNPMHSFAANNKVFITLKISTLDNCYSYKTYMVNFDEDPSSELAVELTSTLLPSGSAYLYQPLAGPGTFYFHALEVINGIVKVPHIPQNQSLLYVIPDLQTTEPVYPTYLPTYSEGALRWQQADDWNFMNPIAEYSLLNYPEPYYGAGSIEAQLIRLDRKHLQVDTLFRLNPFSPGQDADMLYQVDSVHSPFVFLLENQNHETIAFATPNDEGIARFEHLPVGIYYLRGELYRYNNQPVELIISDTDPDIQNLIFTVQEEQIFVQVPEMQIPMEISVFPNPATEEVQVCGIAGNYTSWETYNAMGQLISSGDVPDEGCLTIHRDTGLSGVTLFVAKGRNKIISQKIQFLPAF